MISRRLGWGWAFCTLVIATSPACSDSDSGSGDGGAAGDSAGGDDAAAHAGATSGGTTTGGVDANAGAGGVNETDAGGSDNQAAGHGGGDDGPECAPLTCEARGMNCGSTDDGCGNSLSCGPGSCGDGLVCGAGHTPNVCGAELCAPNGWCWVQGFPEAEYPRRVWAASDTEFWTVNEYGGAMRVKNGVRQRYALPGQLSAAAVWGSSANDVYFVGGGGKIAHFDGTNWGSPTSNTTGELRAVWASGPGDVWAAGTTVVHYDGTSWSEKLTGVSVNDISGTGPNDVTIVGGNGLAAHWNGSSWTPQLHPDGLNLQGVSADATGVWVAAGNYFVRWEGGAWTKKISTQPCSVQRLWRDGAGVFWAVGGEGQGLDAGQLCRFDGTVWLPVQTPTTHTLYDISGGTGPISVGEEGTVVLGGRVTRTLDYDVRIGSDLLTGAWANSPSDIWYTVVAAAGGSLAHFDGARWTSHDLRPLIGGFGGRDILGLGDLWSASPGQVSVLATVVDGGTNAFTTSLINYDGASVYVLSEIDDTATSMWGSSANDIWIGGDKLSHFDGMTATVVTDANENTKKVWGLDAQHVYQIGGSTLMRYDGSSWAAVDTKLPANSALIDVHGSAPDDIWVIATHLGEALASHWNGSAWTVLTLPAAPTAVWSFGPNNVLFTGSGQGLSWDGTFHRSVAAAAADPRDVFMAGGVLRGFSSLVPLSHFNGTAWVSDVYSTFAGSGGHIWGASSTSAWASAPDIVEPGNSRINSLRFDGSNWFDAPLSTGNSVSRVAWGLSDDNVWLLSATEIRHWHGGQIDTFNKPGGRAVWGTSDTDVWMVSDVLSHFNGLAWTSSPPPIPCSLNDIWGTGSNDVWAVGAQTDGSQPVILHYDGTWHVVAAAGITDASLGSLLRVRGVSANDVWMVGGRDPRGGQPGGGIAIHYVSGSFTLYSGASNQVALYYDVWGATANDVWLVGVGVDPDGPRFHEFDHWNGTSITYSTPFAGLGAPFAGGAVRGIWGASASEIWAVGDRGSVFRRVAAP